MIRRAEAKDIAGIARLLLGIAQLHHRGRPDIFRGGSKYGIAELEAIIRDESRPVFVAASGGVGDARLGIPPASGIGSGGVGDARLGVPPASGGDGRRILGYCFCAVEHRAPSAILNGSCLLYIDDFCVDEGSRRLGIGRRLFDAAVGHARQVGARSVELNVWEFNEGARRFYESLGFRTQRRRMEMDI